ncbi:MAG: hydantoinase/oxoprolinase N-terminal domain-containing protein [Pseudobdellovibrionaceae bacterium]
MSWHIGVHIGESFAEVVAKSPATEWFTKRWYLPSENLTIGLQNFWKTLPADIDAEIVVTSRLPEKVLERKLGGTVGLLFTSGLEEWAYLRQPLKYDGFELVPERQFHLANSDAVFGITERMNQKGEILEVPQMTELEFIASKLKMMKIERVCVNLLFSKTNPAHEIAVGEYLTKEGFIVFLSHHCQGSQHEILRWRLNTLNACLSGVFEETKAEIEKSLEGIPIKAEIRFQASTEERFSTNGNLVTSSVFGHLTALASWAKTKVPAPDFSVLHLGLEQFVLLDPFKRVDQWKSPWGPVALEVPEFNSLQIQPTQEITVGSWQCVDFATKDVGYEPGPMCLGRAHRPTLIDLLFASNEEFNVEGLKTLFKPASREKILSSLSTLDRHFSKGHGNPTLIDDLLTHAAQLILQDLNFFCTHKKILLTGALAPTLISRLKRTVAYEFILSEPFDYCESTALTAPVSSEAEAIL